MGAWRAKKNHNRIFSTDLWAPFDQSRHFSNDQRSILPGQAAPCIDDIFPLGIQALYDQLWLQRTPAEYLVLAVALHHADSLESAGKEARKGQFSSWAERVEGMPDQGARPGTEQGFPRERRARRGHPACRDEEASSA